MRIRVVGHPFAKAMAWLKAFARTTRGLVVSTMFASFAGAFLAVWMIYATISCGAKGEATLHAFTTCAEDAAAKGIESTVASILANGPPNGAASWVAQLEALATTYGIDAVNCAVTAAKSSVSAGSASGPTTAIVRADEWLSNHGAK